jgi:hypothetical protein
LNPQPPAGSKILVRVNQMIDGCEDMLYRCEAIVPAQDIADV